MKRLIAICAAVIMLSLVAGTGIANAGSVRSGDLAEVKADETIDGSFYAAGNTVKVAGTIKGDLFCAGQRVEITGTVEGDVICAAQVLEVKGEVLGDARLAGMTVNLGSDIAGSLTLAGQLVTFDKESKIGRDVTLYAADATLHGDIGRDVRLSAETLTLDGIVGRHVHAHDATETRLGETAQVKGDFIYTSEYDAQISDGATVGGKTERLAPAEPAEVSQSETFATYIYGAAFTFTSMILVGLVILGVAPKLLDATARTMRVRHIWAFGLGLIVTLFTPIVAVIVLFTGVGFPLGMLMLLGWGALLFCSTVFTAYTIGEIMAGKLQWQNRWPRFGALGLGFFALFVLALIPFVNILVLGCATIWGIGGLVITVFERLRGTSATPATKPAKAAKK